MSAVIRLLINACAVMIEFLIVHVWVLLARACVTPTPAGALKSVIAKCVMLDALEPMLGDAPRNILK